MARTHSPTQLSPNQSFTDEGYLLCKDVAVARTGYQLYAAGEVPVDPDQDGLITIRRSPDQVFDATTMASFEGKPVTIEHPDDFVDPENWRELSVGITQNVRRGENEENDLLLADLLITDANAIKLVTDRAMREVSCGYDADYKTDAPGAGHQLNIRGNHVALVPRGRAGSRCAIKDGVPDTMKTYDARTPAALMARIRKAFATKDSEALEEVLGTMDSDEDDKEDKGTKDALAKLTATVDALSKTVAALAKTKDGEGINEVPNTKVRIDEGKTTTDEDGAEEEKADKAKAMDSMKTFAAHAELLVPGFKVPTTDSVKSTQSVANLQRSVLTQAIALPHGATTVTPLLRGRALDALSVDAVADLFAASALMRGQANNAANGNVGTHSTKDFGPAAITAAALNERNAQFWARGSK